MATNEISSAYPSAPQAAMKMRAVGQSQAYRGAPPADMAARQNNSPMEYEEDSVGPGDLVEVTESVPSDGQYNGIPVRIQIPREGRIVWLDRGFLDQDAKIDFTAMSFNTKYLNFVVGFLICFCGLALWREREKFIAYLNITK
jgi:hypothetical protein